MGEHAPARHPEAALLVGEGARARETGAVLAALSALDSAGERRTDPMPELALTDLEELLVPRAVEGLLILEAGRVPGEDIGFVRRFLERQAGWRLIVVGESEQDPQARALLALARAQWLAWPPDLAALRALLPRSAPAAKETGRGARARPRRAVPARGVNGSVDLAELLEDLLAGAALRGDEAARYQFSARRGCRVSGERESFRSGLQGLVELARVCAGNDGLVRASLAEDREAVRIRLEFPRGSLAERDVPGLLGGELEVADPVLAEGLEAALRGAKLLREIGAEVETSASEAGRVRCEVRLARQTAPLGSVRPGKAEDPFA
jgi:hypothetical protein